MECKTTLDDISTLSYEEVFQSKWEDLIHQHDPHQTSVSSVIKGGMSWSPQDLAKPFIDLDASSKHSQQDHQILPSQ